MAKFEDVIGQEQIITHLQTAIKLKKISHAYIFEGERNSGKEFIAKLFAQALQCDMNGDPPCNECVSCKQALSSNHPDIIKLIHEKPNSISVDDIRKITNDVMIKPYKGPYKIYIINEAEKMTVQAQNALLKTLEEPPEYAVIILLTTSTEVLLQTILSRCIILSMKPVADELVKKYVMNNLKLPEYKADVCVAFAQGNLGKAKALAMSEEFDNIKTEAVTLLDRKSVV